MQNKTPTARFSRCIRLLNLLQSRVGHRTGQLARDFEVSRRTVYRDIQLLKDAGIPLRFDRGSGGYVVKAFFRARLAPLRDDEFIALLVGACASPLVANQTFGGLIRQASGKLLALTPLALQDEVGRVLRSLTVEPSVGFSYDGQDAVLSEILQAIRHQSRLRITYRRPTGSRSLAVAAITPDHLAVCSEGWYLVGRSLCGGRLCRFDLRHVERACAIPGDRGQHNGALGCADALDSDEPHLAEAELEPVRRSLQRPSHGHRGSDH